MAIRLVPSFFVLYLHGLVSLLKMFLDDRRPYALTRSPQTSLENYFKLIKIHLIESNFQGEKDLYKKSYKFFISGSKNKMLCIKSLFSKIGQTVFQYKQSLKDHLHLTRYIIESVLLIMRRSLSSILSMDKRF